MSKKKDWSLIKLEYETTLISQRDISLKYNVSFNTLKVRANREHWLQNREELNNRITTEVQQKTVDNIIAKKLDRNIQHLEVWDKLLNRVSELAGKDKLLVGVDDNGQLIYEDMNTKMVVELSTSMEKVQKGQRLAEGMSTAMEEARLQLEREKLDIFKKKSGDNAELVAQGNEQITLLADLINNPLPDRSVQDFEEEDESNE